MHGSYLTAGLELASVNDLKEVLEQGSVDTENSVCCVCLLYDEWHMQCVTHICYDVCYSATKPVRLPCGSSGTESWSPPILCAHTYCKFHPRLRRQDALQVSTRREGPGTRSDMVLDSRTWGVNVIGKASEVRHSCIVCAFRTCTP
jgi:hypothetical protein